MADTSGMADLRGLDIDKLAKGFADEEIVFKRFVTNSSTSNREIRWYQKSTGILTSTTPALIENAAPGAMPFITEQSWTRQTSYVRKYFVASPIISQEDIKDCDIDILATNIRDLVRAVSYKVDSRIWDVLTQSRVGTFNTTNAVSMVNCSGGAWNLGSNSNPILDIMEAKTLIREQAYDPEGGYLLLSPASHGYLLEWLIGTKGSSIPSFSSEKVSSGVVMNLLGLNVVVSQNCTAKFGSVGNIARACTWKEFMPITARQVEEVGIGTQIRVWEEGEAILTDPRAVCLLSGCGAL